MLKIKTFRFIGSKNSYTRSGNTNEKVYDKENKIDHEINQFLKDNGYDLVDIKITTIETNYHNNCGYNGVDLLYTVIYK